MEVHKLILKTSQTQGVYFLHWTAALLGGRMEGRNTFYLRLLWRRTYGKGPLRYRKRKPAAVTTWATLSD